MISHFAARFDHPRAVLAALVKISCVAMGGAGLFAAAPAAADDSPTTRLVTCGEQSCLRIEGRRDDVATLVAINGQPMAVDGGESWRVTLPMHTVRQLAEHGSRRLEVTLLQPNAGSERRDYARLPIGLLGDTTELEAIRVTAS